MRGLKEKFDLIIRWSAIQIAIVAIITAVLSSDILMRGGAQLQVNLVMTLLTTLCCSTAIQILMALCIRWEGNGHAAANFKLPSYWPQFPRWRATIVCLLLGTFVGILAANGIGFLLFEFDMNLASISWRQILGTLIFSLFPGVAVASYFLGKSRVEAALSATQNAQRLATENQLRLLESQLEPHMLFNTMANLRVLIGVDSLRAQAMLDHFVAFLRTTLNASRTNSHSLRLEFLRISEYLYLMQIRMGSRLQFELDLPTELAELPIAPLLLQPIVENAIKHGLEPKVDGGTLRISARINAQFLILTVQDTGVGLSYAAANNPPLESDSNFGLKQVHERLAVKYGKLAALSIAPASEMDAGTTVSIQIPTDALDKHSPGPEEL
jgi:hypothetical protein